MTIMSGYAEIEKLSQKMKIDIVKNCGLRAAVDGIPNNLKETKFEMNIYLKKPWEL